MRMQRRSKLPVHLLLWSNWCPPADILRAKRNDDLDECSVGKWYKGCKRMWREENVDRKYLLIYMGLHFLLILYFLFLVTGYKNV